MIYRPAVAAQLLAASPHGLSGAKLAGVCVCVCARARARVRARVHIKRIEYHIYAYITKPGRGPAGARGFACRLLMYGPKKL